MPPAACASNRKLSSLIGSQHIPCYVAIAMANPFLYQSVGSAPAPVTIVNIKGNSGSRGKLCLCLLFGFIALAGVVAFLGITGDLPGFSNGVDPDVPPPPPPLPSQYNHSVGPLLPLDPFVFTTPALVPGLFAISPGGLWLYSLNTATGTIAAYVSEFITGQLSLLNATAYVANASSPTLMYISEGGDFLYLGFAASPAFEVIQIDTTTGDLTGLATVYLSSSSVVAIYDNPDVIYTFVSDSIGNINIIFMAEQQFPFLVSAIDIGSQVISMICDPTSTWLYTLDTSFAIKQWLIANDSAPLLLVNNTGLSSLLGGWTQLQTQSNMLFVLNTRVPVHTVFIFALDPVSGALSSAGTFPATTTLPVTYLSTSLFLYIIGTVLGTQEMVSVDQYALSNSSSIFSPLDPASFVVTTLAASSSQPLFLLSAGLAQGSVYVCLAGNQSILQYVIE